MNTRRLVIPLLSVAGLAIASYTIVRGNAPMPVTPLQAQPPRPGFAQRVSGAGIIESASEDTAVGLPVAGRIDAVLVQRGQRVQQGDPLLRLEDASLRAQLATRQSQLLVAQAELQRLESYPRAEDLPPLEARVAAAKVAAADAQAQLRMVENLRDPRAVSEDLRSQRRYAAEAAQVAVAQAEAELARARAGTFAPELALARAQVSASQALVAELEVEIERRIVRAPFAGTILQLNARKGEWAEAGTSARPLVLLGDLSQLHVRIDIDENDAWRVRPGARALGFVKGNGQLSTPLEFVRIDPYVLPKRSLTGDSFERVDTRVLQVVYRFAADALPVYVGQQMDVFLEANADAGASAR